MGYSIDDQHRGFPGAQQEGEMRYHIICSARLFIGMDDDTLLKMFPMWSIDALRDRLSEMSQNGDFVPAADCDNFDDHGRCLGHVS